MDYDKLRDMYIPEQEDATALGFDRVQEIPGLHADFIRERAETRLMDIRITPIDSLDPDLAGSLPVLEHILEVVQPHSQTDLGTNFGDIQ